MLEQLTLYTKVTTTTTILFGGDLAAIRTTKVYIMSCAIQLWE